MGGRDRFRPDALWDAFDAPNESDLDLQTDEESPGCPVVAWPYKARLSPAPDYVPCGLDALI